MTAPTNDLEINRLLFGADVEQHVVQQDRLTGTRAQLMQWVLDERRNYADVKYSDANRQFLVDDLQEHPHPGGDDGQWANFYYNYLKRAELFGLDTPQGRQALGKAITTLMHLAETAVDTFGPMPQPGVPSGELRDWVD